MSTPIAPAPRSLVSKRTIEDWAPNDGQWCSKTAWTTLAITTFNLTLAFIVWYLPGALIPTLGTITLGLHRQPVVLAACHARTHRRCAAHRVDVPAAHDGTRRMLTLSALLMLIPFAGWVWVVTLPQQPAYGLLVALALAAGLGGGVFSGYMPSTSYFFPKAKQGTALGLQAGLGNFGVSVVQFVVPWAIGFSMFGIAGQVAHKTVDGEVVAYDVWLHNPGMIFIPFAVVGAILAWTMLKSVNVQANPRQQLDIFRNKHT